MLAMVVTALMVLCGASADSSAWTLAECVERALAVDPRIRGARIDRERCRRTAALALSDLLPAVSVSIGNDFGWGRSVDMQELLIINNRMNYAASVSAAAAVSSSDICGAALRRKEERYAALASEESLNLTLEEVVSETASAYVEALYAQQALEASRVAFERIEDQVKSLEFKIINGTGKVLDLEELEAQRAAERMALAEASGRCSRALLALKRLLDLPPEEELGLLPPTADSYPGTECLHQLASRAGDGCGVRRAEALLEGSRLRLRRARLAYFPSVSVSGGLGTYYGNTGSASFGEQMKGNLNPSLGIALTIPVLDGSARARELNEARSEMAGLEVEVERQRRERAAAVGDDIAVAEGIYGCLGAAEAEVAAAEKAQSAAQARFDAGEISGTELVLAGSRLKAARLGLLQQQCRYILQIKAIEYRYGIELCE